MPLKEPPFGTVTYFHLFSSHLSLGLRTFVVIALISAPPHLSGPNGAGSQLLAASSEVHNYRYYGEGRRRRQGNCEV
jgi:hypothetical protein